MLSPLGVQNKSLWRTGIRALIDGFFAFTFFLPYLIAARVFRSPDDTAHSPRVLWGPTALKPIHYNSRALQTGGIDSKTLVEEIYSINQRSDFDELIFDPGTGAVMRLVKRYLKFFWVLKNADVIITTYDGAFLRHTGLRFLEHLFYRAGHKALLVWPYGADSYVPSKMSDLRFRDGLLESYPQAAAREKEVEKQIAYFCRVADLVIGNIPHDESCPRSDVATVACYGLDENEWKPDSSFRHQADGRSSEVVILHCPNHPAVKGTPHIVAAVEKLRSEGWKVRLDVVQGVPNTVLRDRMKNCDIVAAQVLYGYASTEIEGMALGKPVITNLEHGPYYDRARRETPLAEAPLVSATPEILEEQLRRLIADPNLRKKIGDQGRQYFLDVHSFPALSRFWGLVIARARAGRHEATELARWWKSVSSKPEAQRS